MNKAIELGNMGIIELGAPPSLGGASALVQEKHAGLLAEGKKQAEKFGLKVATDAATNLPTGFASAMSSPTGVLASIGAAALPAFPPAGAAIMVVAAAADMISNVFGGSGGPPPYTAPTSHIYYSPSTRDWVVVRNALRLIVENEKAMEAAYTAVNPWWGIKADGSKQGAPLPEFKALAAALLKDLNEWDQKTALSKMDNWFSGDTNDEPRILRAPQDLSMAHWFVLSAYTPHDRYTYNVGASSALRSALLHAALVQYAQAMYAHVYVYDYNVANPFPAVVRVKDLEKQDKMNDGWRGNLSFVLGWTEVHTSDGKAVTVQSWPDAPGKKQSFDAKAKVIRQLYGGNYFYKDTTKVNPKTGQIYLLRPLVAYRANGKPSDANWRMQQLAYFQISQVPGEAAPIFLSKSPGALQAILTKDKEEKAATKPPENIEYAAIKNWWGTAPTQAKIGFAAYAKEQFQATVSAGDASSIEDLTLLSKPAQKMLAQAVADSPPGKFGPPKEAPPAVGAAPAVMALALKGIKVAPKFDLIPAPEKVVQISPTTGEVQIVPAIEMAAADKKEKRNLTPYALGAAALLAMAFFITRRR